MIPFAFLALAAQVAAASPPANNTTDVDQNTTPAEASPLAPTTLPSAPEAPPPGARSLDDILSAVQPYEPPAPPIAAPEETPRPGLVLAVPANPARPTFLNDRDSRPDGPPTDADTLYESRVLGAFRAAEDNQGPLDGRWRVARAGGGVLYTLQFSDSRDRIEGAWRDMTAPGKTSVGLIDTIDRGETDTVVRFSDGARPAELRIHPAADGGWIGQAITPAGRIPVVMTRDQSVELVASRAPIYVPPPPPVGRPAKHGKAAKGHASAHGKAKSKGSARAKSSSARSKKKKR